MASYIHYERYCSNCKKYFEKKPSTCSKCGNALKSINKWYVTFRYDDLGVTKQKKLGAFKTKADAEQGYLQLYNNSKDLPINYTFEQLIADVLLKQKAENKSSSYVSYKTIYKRFARINKVKVQNINDKLLHELYTEIKQKYTATCTQNASWGALGFALNYASKYKDIDAPLKAYKRIKPIQIIRKQKPSWTAEQAKQFLECIHNLYLEELKKDEDILNNPSALTYYMHYVLFSYFLYMANRRGEVIALKVCKVNFKDNYVTIDENITNKVLPEERAKGITYKTVTRKNNHVLIEYMPKNISSLLAEYIKTLKLKPNDYLFFRNKPLNPESIRRVMAKYVALAKVPPMTPHQFRHTHASLIFAQGNSKIEDAYVVAKRLGHNVKYTLDTYGSLYKEREQDIIDNINF